MKEINEIRAAAEAAEVYYEETHDGVLIGDVAVEAHIGGFYVARWIGRGPDARLREIALVKDAEEAVNIALEVAA